MAEGGRRRQLWIAHIENKVGCHVGSAVISLSSVARDAAQRPLMVHHFHDLVTGARGNSVGSREEMCALPDPACLQALFPCYRSRTAMNPISGALSIRFE